MIIPEWMVQLSDFNHCAELLTAMPGGRLPVLGVVDYSHIDSGLLDGELFPVSIVGFDRLTNWEGLGDEEYQARKNAWLDAVIRRLDEEWPGFSGAVVQKDIATARTMHDYLNTPGGALYGFAPNVPDKMPWSGSPRTPRTSIQGLWLASSYAGAGGFTGAMSAGGAAAKAALHELI
jgi:phytoene dehydrogenase-like protein